MLEFKKTQHFRIQEFLYFIENPLSLLTVRKTCARPQMESIWIQALQLDHSHTHLTPENSMFAS